MKRFPTRSQRRQDLATSVRPRWRAARRHRRLLLETLEDRRLLTGATELTNVVPASQVTQFESPLAFTTFRNNAFSILGENSDLRQVDVTFTTTHGHLSLVDMDSINGPTFDQGDGNDDTSFTLRGTIDDVNLALQWLVFQPDSQYSGTASITLQTVDFDPLSETGAESDTDTVSIAVQPADNWADSPSWNTEPGMLDNRFHDTGKLTHQDIQINRVLLAGPNQLLAVGEKDQQLALAQLHRDGTLDTSFGNGGIVTTNLTGTSHAEDLAILPDGRILVVGSESTNSNDSQLVVARYHANGSIDTTFASDGLFKFDWDANDSNEQAYAVSFQANGKIVIAGTGADPQSLLVVQLHSSGVLDPLFGNNGKVSIDLENEAVGTDLVVFDDGTMLVGATVYDENFALVRLDYEGHLVNSWLTEMGDQETVNDLLVYPDGRILLAGQANDHFAIARFQSDGSLDPSFGTEGKVYTAVGDHASAVQRLILQADGKLLAVGQTDNGSDQDFAVVRYHRDGTLDTSFDGDGIRSVPFEGDDIARDILLLEDQSLLVLGGTNGTATALVQLVGDAQPGEVQGKLFHDHNGDGTQNPGEPGLAGWTIFLDLDHDNQLDSGETSMLTATDDPATPDVDETGSYQFTDLVAGHYTVGQIIPEDWLATTPLQEVKTESFDQESAALENGWISNNPVPGVQTIGFSMTSHAGGSTGEGHAFWKRHESPEASYYADTNMVRSVTFDDYFTASGTIEVQNPTASLGDRGYLGFFHSAQDGPDGDSQNVTLAGFSFDENNWSLSFWQTSSGYQSGLGRVDSPTTAITADTDLNFSFSYDPHGGDHGYGLLSGSLGGQQQTVHLTPADRTALQGKSLDAFGLYRPAVNDGNYDQPGIHLYVDELDYRSWADIEVRATETKANIDVGVQNPNQGPQLHLPNSQTVAEDTDLLIQGLSVSDPDAGDEPVRIMLSVLHGTLSLTQTTGLTFQAGDGIANSLITMTGSVASINAAFNGLTYRAQQDYFGTDFLATYVNDLGNRGDGLPLSDSQTLPITVTSVNDAPVAVDDVYQVDENQQLNVPSQGVMVNDHDVENDTLQVITISEPAHGSLVLNSNGSVFYVPDQNFNQTDSFTYQLNDGTDLSNIATVRVNVKTQFVWHNSVNPYDVNGDGAITAQDVIQIINTLNQLGARELPTDRPFPLAPPFYDVNRDGFVSPNDVIAIINLLNEEIQAEAGGGEGEDLSSEIPDPLNPQADIAGISLSSPDGQDLIAEQTSQQLPENVAGVTQVPLADRSTPDWTSNWQRVNDAVNSFTDPQPLRSNLSENDENDIFEQPDWLESLTAQVLDELLHPSR